MSVPDTFLGIDIAKATFDVALDGVARRHGHFANTPAGYAALQRWLDHQQVGPVWAVMEATGSYGEALADWLHQAGHRVSVVNPARVKAYGQSRLRRAKTDRLDAALIRDFGCSQRPPLWTPPPAALQELRALVRRLADLQQMQQQERNRLAVGQRSAVVRADLQAQLAALVGRIGQLRRHIETLLQTQPELAAPYRLLRSIAGIGPLTAARLLAELPPIHHFTSPKQLVAYAGLSPAIYQSGTSVHRRARISKQGNSVLRAQLYMPALVALRHNPVMQALQQRLQQAGKAKMVIVVAAMRKLLHLVYGVLKSGRPFDPAIALPAPNCP
jgi:transposase